MANASLIEVKPAQTGEVPRPNRRWTRADLISALIILTVSVVVRAPWLDHSPLSPDESIYEGRASYLLSVEQTAFARPIGVEHTVELYRWVAAIVGPYRLDAVRSLVLLFCIAIALGIYGVVRRSGNWLPALVASLLFVYFNVYFEGLSANREWFALAGLAFGAFLFLAADTDAGRRGWLLLLASGCATGSALWFKHQAVPLVGVIPLLLLVQCLGPSRGGAGRQLVAFGVGIALAGAIYFLPFLLAGTVREHLHFVIDFRGRYAFSGSNVATTALPVWKTYWYLLYQAVPFRTVLGFAFFAGVAAAATWITGLVRQQASVARSIELRSGTLFLLYFLAAWIAIGMGQRFFAHYFLFMVFPVTVLIGWGVAWLADERWRRWPGQLLVVIPLALYTVDLAFVPFSPPVDQFGFDRLPTEAAAALEQLATRPHFPTFLVAAGGAVLMACAALALLRGYRTASAWTGWIVVGLLYVVVAANAGWMVAKLHALPAAVARVSDYEQELGEVIAYLGENAAADDRLYVWGFVPELYSLTKLQAASQLTTATLVLGDVRGTWDGPPQIDPYYGPLLLEELTSQRPRFIVDAAARSVHSDFYVVEHYPALLDMLEQDYVLKAIRNECRVYERK